MPGVDESEDIIGQNTEARLDEGRCGCRFAGSGGTNQSDTAAALQLDAASVQANDAAQTKYEPENGAVQIDSCVFERQPIGPTGKDFGTRLVQVKTRAVGIL